MPYIGEASALELDAAAALLKLQCCDQPQETKPLIHNYEGRAEMTIGRGGAIPNDDVTASKFMKRLSVKVTSTPLKSYHNIQRRRRSASPRVIRVVAPCSENNGYIVKKKFRASLTGHSNMSIHEMYLKERKRWSQISKHNARQLRRTRDVGTQTDENKTRKEAVKKLENLTERIKELEKRLQETLKANIALNFDDEDKSEEDDSESSNNDSPRRFTKRETKSSTSTIKEEFNSDEDSLTDEDMDTDEDYEEDDNEPRRNAVRRQSIDGNEGKMIKLGNGTATVPDRVYRQINWSSHTSATRKLLTAVFPRSILATHSLTGKPSPAFPNKPAKARLDPVLVDDIILTVMNKCGATENIIRTSITTKCADESKMLRNRQKKTKTSRVSRKENDPPTVSSSSSAASR